MTSAIDTLDPAFRSEIKAAAEDLENNEKDTFAGHRHYLELYGFLLHWTLLVAEEKTTSVTSKSKVSRFVNQANTFLTHSKSFIERQIESR